MEVLEFLQFVQRLKKQNSLEGKVNTESGTATLTAEKSSKSKTLTARVVFPEM